MILYRPKLMSPKSEADAQSRGSGRYKFWKTDEYLKHLILCVKDNEKFGKGQVALKSEVSQSEVRSPAFILGLCDLGLRTVDFGL